MEMGYNDCNVTQDKAAKSMTKQAWFQALAAGAGQVQRVIFIAQPSYHLCVMRPSGKKKSSNCLNLGDMVAPPSWIVDAAVELVQRELHLETHVLIRPAEELYVGFCRDEAGELWQDASTCKTYTEHAVIYAANGEKALWEDAYHPSTTGAEEHLRLLIGVLQ